MRHVRVSVFLLLLGFGLLPLMSNSAEAGTSFGFSVGYHGYPYYGYRHYYRPYFYRPYYWGFSPYYYGWPYSFGFGYGYGGYGGYYEGYGEIRTEVKPQNANVFVNGDYVGVVDDFDGWWQKLTLPPGKYRLTFRSPGYAPYVVTMRILPGEDYHIEQDLQPGEDKIAEQDMRLPPGEEDRYSRRYRQPYDRDYYGNDRDDRDYYGDDRDEYRDEYRDDRRYGNKDWEQERNRDRESYSTPPPAESRPTLIIRIEPQDASLYVDGTYYGTAGANGIGEIQALLPEGVHRIEVVRPGYETYVQDITVNPAGENRLSIRLQKK